MAQQQSPWLEAKYGWNFGESNWNTGVDENLLKFSFLFDRNVDGVVSTLPAAVNGKAYFLTTDNRLYFTVNTTYFSCPTPKWFEFVVRGTGVTYQFNGTSAIQVESLIGVDSRLDAVELSVASLGTASSKDVDFFASTSRVDVVEANAQSTTDRAVQVVGDYAAGLVLRNRNQGFRYLGDIYLPGDGITLPYTTTGAGAAEIATFRSVGDAVLRGDLADPLIGGNIVARSIVVCESIAHMTASAKDASKIYKIKGFHAGQYIGDGEFCWDASKPKTSHDGGLIVDPDRSFPSPWDSSNLAAVNTWFEPSASGTGCFVRINSKEVTLASFGCLATDTTVDHPSFAYAVKATAAKSLTLRLLPGTHLIGEVEIVSNTDIIGDAGAVIKRDGNFGLILGYVYPDPDNVKISGIVFDNNAPGTAGTHKFCMRIGNATNVKLSNLHMSNGYDSAIKANGPDGLYIRTLAPSNKNNITIDGCTFDGFTRNGMSITDGVNGLSIKGCTFQNNGLTGLDIEANVGSSLQVSNVLIENNKFINNGDFANSGSSPFPTGHLGLFSATPTAFHSQDVTIVRNTFETTTALKAGGVFSIIAASAKRLKILDNIFVVSDAYLAANGYGANLNIEASSYKSEDIVFSDNSVSNHIFQSYSTNYQKVERNSFYGAWTKILLGNATSNQITLSDNTFLSCASSADVLVSAAGRGLSIENNSFVEDRASNAPLSVISTNFPRGAVAGLSVKNNATEVRNSSRWGKFFSSENSTGSKGSGIQITGNNVNGCVNGGIVIRDTLSFPASSDISISGNKINSVTSGYAIDTYRIANQIISGNIIAQGSTGTPMVRIDLAGYTNVTGNVLTWSGASPASYGISFNTPQVANSSVAANNITSGTTSGNSIAAGVLAANNVVI